LIGYAIPRYSLLPYSLLTIRYSLFMFRTVFLTLVTLAIAIGGGAASVWYALQVQEGIGAVTVGNWTAYPQMGAPEADPYSKARAAREGLLALGRAEGLSFFATRDTGGEQLSRKCSYLVEGSTPPARFWTLYAADRSFGVISGERRRKPAVQSLDILRNADNSFAIAIGPDAMPGNWLSVSGDGPMVVVLTLYDTPVAGTIGVEDVELPQVLRTGCHA
jgi:hypothetical protein